MVISYQGDMKEYCFSSLAIDISVLAEHPILYSRVGIT
jgi:hypothetical protein